LSIGTLYYICPASQAEQMITALLDDVRDDGSAVFHATETHPGLEHAIRHGLDNYWKQLVVNDTQLALMRHELFAEPYALAAGSTWPAGRSRATPGSWPSGDNTPPTTPARSAPPPPTPSPGLSSAASWAPS